MPTDFIQFGFTSGEVSSAIGARTDLEKYDFGLAKAVNWYCDYRGKLNTRPGTKFIDFIEHDDKNARLFPFAFSPERESSYEILMGDGYIRFLQNGSYVFESAKTVTAVTLADPAVVTSAAHGYSDGDLVRLFDVVGPTELNKRLFKIAAVTTNTFALKDIWGNDIDSSALDAFTSGEVARVYTISNPFNEADFDKISYHQRRSLVTFTCHGYRPQELVRLDHADWVINPMSIGPNISTPTNITLDPSATGSAGAAFVVTAVNSDGEESLASDYAIEDSSINYSDAVGSIKVKWDIVPGAQYYKVYRTLIMPDGSEVTRGADVGYIGRAFGTEFVDTNINPDFGHTPPQFRDPFAPGAIKEIQITAGGSGYDGTSTVSVSGGSGSGFVGYPVIDSSGAVSAVRIVNHGEDYDNPTVSFGGAGTGAAATAEAEPLTGRDPGVATHYQQRRVFAASENDPLTLWGSRIRLFSNFDDSRALADNDSYEHELDTESAAPIIHLLPSRAGLVIFTQDEILQLSGGNRTGITPTNALSEPQSYTGSARVRPLQVDTDMLYLEGKGTTVRLLTYNDYSKVYSGQDVSILSSHLFVPGNQIDRWAFAQDPDKLILSRRPDGSVLCLTLVKEQNVYGWTRWYTRGEFMDLIAVQAGQREVVSTIVRRKINGRWVKYIEQVSSREFTHVEDAWCVDAGLDLPLNYPDAILTISAATGSATVTASAAVFGSASVGDILRAGGGKAVVTAVTSSTELEVDWLRPLTDTIWEDPSSTPKLQASGTWTLMTPSTTVGNLHHLEGEEVSILADGNAVPRQTVVDGKITLSSPFTRVIVGIPYTCEAETLPIASRQMVVEGKVKRILSSVVTFENTRGLFMGTTTGKLYPIKERTNESYNEATRLQNGSKSVGVGGTYDPDTALRFQQVDPLPASILRYVSTVDIGDDDY